MLVLVIKQVQDRRIECFRVRRGISPREDRRGRQRKADLLCAMDVTC